MKIFLILSIFVCSVYAGKRISPDLKPLTDEIVKAINDLDTSWKAGKTFDGTTAIDINKLVSTLNESYNNDFHIANHTMKKDNFPTYFDAREFWPECPSIGKIYDQTKGVPSWVYPSVGQIADRLCIKYGVQIDVEATVERIAKATNGFNGGYQSADFDQAFKYWSKKGILTVKSVNGTDCLPSSECEMPEIQFDKYYKIDVISPYYQMDIEREIMQNGPLTIQMAVYADFPSYKSGVYQHTTDNILGTHVVNLIGWGNIRGNLYWLATNSWATQWGEQGLFKIKRGTNEFSDLSGATKHVLSASFIPMDYITFIPKQDQMFDLA